MSKVASKESYRKNLREGKLTHEYVDKVLKVFQKPLVVKSINNLEKSEKKKLNISKYLDRLPLYIISGNKSWKGLAVGFPGNTADLTTESVGTPFLRMLLYPLLDLFQRVSEEHLDGEAKCLYFMGARFPDVFLRKFSLISSIIPHSVILTNDLFKTIRPKPPKDDSRQDKNLESYLQGRICSRMHQEGVLIPNEQDSFTAKYLSYEVQTAEGTKKPERLDILGYDEKDHALIAFEIKGKCGDAEFNNLFTQGMEHRNWLENNKMAIKLITEGPKGKMINTKKRVKLVLGACRETVPGIFRQLKDAALKDKHMQISLVQIVKENDNVRLEPVSFESKDSTRHV